MKTKRYLMIGILGIALAGVVVTGCKKKDQPSTDSDVTAAEDEANASFALQDSKTIADGAAQNQSVERVLGSPCGTWTKRDTVIGSNTDTLIQISFPGTCTSPDGRTRKGDIFVFWNGKRYFDSACVITMTFKNYDVTLLNGKTVNITGTRTLTNIGKDSAGDCSWSFNANLSLTYISGATGTATWTSSRTNVLTKQGNDYYYVITGGANGVTRNGVSYTISITSPLYHTAYWLNLKYGYALCDCFESGEVEITRSNKTYPLYLQFTSGVGSCNHTATATINGNNYNITLP